MDKSALDALQSRHAFKPFSSDVPVTTAVVAIDLGYSMTRRSCGLASSGGIAKSLTFGGCVAETAKVLGVRDNVILVLEAPLSMRHDERGNPAYRGDFEHGRGWHCGPGATVCLAAIRFLPEIYRQWSGNPRILLAEAFLSNKKRATGDDEDARTILGAFWATQDEPLFPHVEPASHLIDGVPPVRVFKAD